MLISIDFGLARSYPGAFAKTPTQEQKRDAIDCRMETQQSACGHE
jgi:hypothetical protein